MELRKVGLVAGHHGMSIRLCFNAYEFGSAEGSHLVKWSNRHENGHAVYIEDIEDNI
jgi:hypothetical protein